MGIVKTKAKNEKLKKKEGECFIMEKAIINQKEAQKGITLIALVITTIFSYDENIKSNNNKGFFLQSI